MQPKIQEVIAMVVNTPAIVATQYVSPKLTIRATRITTRGKSGKKRVDNNVIDIRFHMGRPNYRERKFIKDCIKAGVKFPVKKIQLKFLPAKKKK